MAGICLTSIRRGGAGCDHRTVTVNLDGTVISLDIGEGQLDNMLWTDVEKEEFVRLGLKRLRTLGLALDNAVGLVTNGEEGTNVKQYMLLTRDITKTNIGATYVDIPPGLNGERSLVEFTGCSQFRAIMNMNFIGVGPMHLRIVRDGDSTVLYESPNINAPTGEKELDSNWQPLPPAINGLTLIRVQGKSVTVTDGPIFRRCILLVK